jgi:hypothetical protein
MDSVGVSMSLVTAGHATDESCVMQIHRHIGFQRLCATSASSVVRQRNNFKCPTFVETSTDNRVGQQLSQIHIVDLVHVQTD